VTRFSACVASPHRHASEAGLAVLRDGGNALDAAIATNLVLGVVTPYHCGYGGDVFAMVWDGEAVRGYLGAGAAPRDASREEIVRRAGAEQMPLFGALPVTVPGAVRGWFDLLERYGSRSFGDLARHAVARARDGFEVGPLAEEYVARARMLYAGEEEWTRIFGDLLAGDRLVQPELAQTIELLASDGPDAFYGGPIGQAIAAEIGMRGGLLDLDDLRAHAGEWVAPLEAAYRDLRVLELPPPTQGVTVLEALRILDGLPQNDRDGSAVGDPGRLAAGDEVARVHASIEAVKMALADRDLTVTESRWMTVPASRLLREDVIAERRARLDPSAAVAAPPGRPARGGTAFICAADAGGMMVSLIQSNWIGFGSGIVVSGWGIGLQNRGSAFSLDPKHPNVIAPRKRTLHTLIPGMAFRGAEPVLAFGSMGGDGQAQTHVQLLGRLVDEGLDPSAAVDAPRWVVRVNDWSVIAEDRIPAEVIEGLRTRGHRVRVTGSYDSVMGHAHVIARAPSGGYEAGSDPRAEGTALGF